MSSSTSEQNEQRRRLIRAAVGVPVVFTLPCGAALAQTSMACSARSLAEFEAAQVPLFPSGSSSYAGDSWVRRRFQAMEFKLNSGPWRFGFVDASGSWYEIGSDGQLLNRYGALDIKSSRAVSGKYYYAVVNYPDQTVIASASDLNIAPIAGASCWNSLAGAAELNSNIIA